MRIRPVTEADLPFVREMLYAAALWRPRELSEAEWDYLHGYLALYHEGWGRDGDAGVIAEEDGSPLGAAWYRLFAADAGAGGFVDDQTPELAIAVVEDARGRGVGRALLEALHEHGRRTGLRRIALSVNADNPAKHLYAALGYTDVAPDDERERMVLEL